jgi:hypothetical protein
MRGSSSIGGERGIRRSGADPGIRLASHTRDTTRVAAGRGGSGCSTTHQTLARRAARGSSTTPASVLSQGAVMSHHRRRCLPQIALIGAALLGAASAPALAQSPWASATPRIVTPQNSPWVVDQRGSNASAAITGTNPKSGNGSLELHDSGNIADWGWYELFAGDPFSSGWGLLENLDHLSFSWNRASDAYAPNEPVWQAQSVAFRLFVRSTVNGAPAFSELVWERYYNGPAESRDSWHSEDLTGQLFWRFVDGQGYTTSDCGNPSDITPGIPIKLETPTGWAGTNGCFAPADAYVYGIGVGVGSGWPLPFTGFADDVQLGFNGMIAVNDNFELADQGGSVTPEPASLALIASGLAGVGVAMRRRRKLVG